MARATAFLLLSDSKSSFSIEGERPSPKRAARWGQNRITIHPTKLLRCGHPSNIADYWLLPPELSGAPAPGPLGMAGPEEFIGLLPMPPIAEPPVGEPGIPPDGGIVDGLPVKPRPTEPEVLADGIPGLPGEVVVPSGFAPPLLPMASAAPPPAPPCA